ncbi:hypothetical protein C0W59_19365 [Photobacterium kishitanii]|uniref:hypothetical protein n=1 Tax=Photobacterium kishitanii TaxID=318456 RepID=UPI000D17C4B1|nr:hypothetical protein [Photobacterium kishitanii]PSV11692.1 hypothetical protein C0W59_19365 [Photobacterium kishitanii]
MKKNDKRFWANYIFIFIPFIVLLITKLVISKPIEVLTSTDWSVASFMIIAQSMGLIITESYGQKEINKNGLLIFIGITLILLIVCLGVYAYVISRNTLFAGLFQIILFIFASLWMAGIYKATDYLEKKSKNEYEN